MNADVRVFNFESSFSESELTLDIGDINQIAEVSLEKGLEWFEHNQICDEFTYVLSGQAEIYSNGDCQLLSAGQIHFIRKGVNHRLVATPEQNFRYICIAFHPNPENADVKAFMDTVGDKTHFVVNDSGYIKPLCELTVREFYRWDEHSADMVNKALSQILILIRRCLNNDEFSYSSKSKKNSSVAMYEVLRYIDVNYLQISSVLEIANALSYSEYYLPHLFKEKIGFTMKEYINRKKITHAMELLRQCDLTVEQIANHLNFESARAFRRVFKQYAGCTPSAYRELSK